MNSSSALPSTALGAARDEQPHTDLLMTTRSWSFGAGLRLGTGAGLGTGRARARLPLLALVALLVTLPLEWITVTGAGGGFIKVFHVAAIALIVLTFARWRPGRLLGPVVARFPAVYVAYGVMLAATFFGGLVYADPFVSHSDIARNAFYAATSLVIAGVVVATRPRGALAWVCPVTLVTLLATLGAALAVQHVDPLAVIGQAFAQADPDLITRRLLRSAFRSDEGLAEAAPNLRHNVFGALLLTAFVAMAYRPLLVPRRRGARAAVTVCSVVAFALVVLSLSRSTIACLVVALLPLPLRALVRRRLRYGHAALAALAGVGVVGLALSPAGALLASRFTAVGSYQARLEAAGPSFLDEFGRAAAFGTTDAAVPRSPHNFVLQAWLAGGAVAAVAAVVLIVFLLVLWLRELRRYATGAPGWVLPVGQVWVVALGVIPLVRSVTAGNGFHLIEWAALGLFLGLLLANERARRRGPGKPAPPRRQLRRTSPETAASPAGR